MLGLPPQKSPVVRLQLLLCSSLAGPAAQKNLKQSDCSCCPAALLLGLPPQKSQVRRVQLLSCSFPTGPATKKSKVVRLQLLPCSPLAGPAATTIASSQIAVATLQLPCWTCRPKNLKQSDCSCCPAALLLGLPPQKSQVRRVQLLSCSFLTGPATKKSKVVRLQLLPCSSLAGPAATKISSSQIAVATLQLSCWTCRPKNLKQSDCSCCPAALLLGLPPQKPQVRRAQLLSCRLSYWACHQKIQNSQIAVATLQPSYWAYRQKTSSSQIAVATVAFLILNGLAVQKISSSQIAVASLQLSCWACRLKNLKYADCSCSALFMLKRKIWSRSVQAKNFEIDATHNQIRANQHCL